MELQKEYYSILEAAKKFNYEEFDFIYIGAFENFPVFIFVNGINFEYERFIDEDDNGQPIFEMVGNEVFYTGYLQLLEFYLKRIYAEKSVSVRMNKFISPVSNINEWAVLDPFEEIDINNLSRLYVRAEDVNKLKEKYQNNESDLKPRVLNDYLEKIGRREQQLEIILAVITALNFEPLQIPDGGKAKIKVICLTRPKFFTDAAFDHAWKEGVAKGLFKLENSDKYSKI